MTFGINEIQLIIKICILFFTLIAFFITFNVQGQIKNVIKHLNEKRKASEEKEVDIIILPSKIHTRVVEELQKPSRKYFNYQRLDKFLKQNGAGFISGYFINPVNFIFIKCIISVIILFLCMIIYDFSFIIGLFLSILGFFLLDYLIYSQNKSDNKKMFDDVERANETIKMYGETSGTLYNAIFECYKFTENKRLKQGFFELYGELQMTHSYELAIKHFLEKFNNNYLTILAKNIEQAGTVGFNELLLEDMTKDIAELQRELNYNYRSALKTKWSLILMGIFISMLAICLYAMVGSFNIDFFV